MLVFDIARANATNSFTQVSESAQAVLRETTSS